MVIPPAATRTRVKPGNNSAAIRTILPEIRPIRPPTHPPRSVRSQHGRGTAHRCDRAVQARLRTTDEDGGRGPDRRGIPVRAVHQAISAMAVPASGVVVRAVSTSR